MKSRLTRAGVLALAGGIVLACPHAALACATCYGASDSDMARGMNLGIVTLLAVILSVLGSLTVFFLALARRAALASASTTMRQGPANPPSL